MKNSSLAANKTGKVGLNLFTKPCPREYLLSDLSANCLEKSYLYSLSLFELTHSSFRRKPISPGCLSEIISSNYLKLHLLEAVKQGWANMLKNQENLATERSIESFENLQYIPGNTDGHLYVQHCAHDHERLQKALISQWGVTLMLSKKYRLRQ